MKVFIIGWYGTETIGDRAILGGILKSLSENIGSFELQLGALYPFYSKRMLIEDASFFSELTSNKLKKTSIVDTKNSNDLTSAIKDNDILIMGGGPLMDLPELNMVEYAFKKAKKLNKLALIFSCGVGPLYKKENRKKVANIFNLSSGSIVRDNASLNFLKEIDSEFRSNINFDNVSVNFDPAVNCVSGYVDCLSKPELIYSKNAYIALNLRSFPMEYSKESAVRNIDQELCDFVKAVATRYHDKKIILIPMHYFHIGGDDRVFLNDISLKLGLDNIHVQNEPLSLKATISLYENAYFNIGMRFHSVVLQTVCSGKNYILDYTEPNKGKIFGFVQDIDTEGFYDDRYICIQSTNVDASKINFDSCDEKLKVDFKKLRAFIGSYSSLFNGKHL